MRAGLQHQCAREFIVLYQVFCHLIPAQKQWLPLEFVRRIRFCRLSCSIAIFDLTTLCYRKMQVAPENWHDLGPGRICFDWSILVLHLIKKRRPPGLHQKNQTVMILRTRASSLVVCNGLSTCEYSPSTF